MDYSKVSNIRFKQSYGLNQYDYIIIEFKAWWRKNKVYKFGRGYGSSHSIPAVEFYEELKEEFEQSKSKICLKRILEIITDGGIEDMENIPELSQIELIEDLERLKLSAKNILEHLN